MDFLWIWIIVYILTGVITARLVLNHEIKTLNTDKKELPGNMDDWDRKDWERSRRGSMIGVVTSLGLLWPIIPVFFILAKVAEPFYLFIIKPVKVDDENRELAREDLEKLKVSRDVWQAELQKAGVEGATQERLDMINTTIKLFDDKIKDREKML